MNTSPVLSLLKPDAEAAVLGSCLIDPQALEWVFYNVPEEEFLDRRNRTLFQVMRRMKKAGMAVDITTLTNSLTKSDERRVTVQFILELHDSVQSTLNVRHYSSLMHKSYVNQRLGELYEKIKADPLDTETQKEIRKLWDSLSNDQNTIIDIKEASLRYVEVLESRKSGKISRLLSGYPVFDRLTGGFLQGNLVSVGARTSVGKTAFLLNLAVRFLKRGLRVLFISAEMPVEELLDRVVSMESALFVSRLRRGDISSEDFPKINKTLADLSEHQFWCVEGGRMGISRVRLSVEVTKPDVIFVDFIQRFTPPNYNINRSAYFSDVANELKNIAKENRVVVIAASQLNREIEKDDNREPRLSDFKESGGIEEAADYALLLRSEKETSETMPTKGVTLYVKKSRNGPCGEVKFRFIKARTLFEEDEDIDAG